LKREDQGVEKKGSMVEKGGSGGLEGNVIGRHEGRIRGIRRECNRTTGREDHRVGKVGPEG